MLSTMEKLYILKHSKRKLSALLFALLLTSISTWSYGQYQKIATISSQFSATQVEVDRAGDLYVLSDNKHIQHLSTEGKIIHQYKGKSYTSFEPRDGSRHFLYDRSTQTYQYVNPSFEISVEHHVDEAFAIDPYFVCSSGDYNIWILDKADWSLKRVDTKKNLILVEVILPDHFSKSETDYVRMREYQGFLFLATHQHIHIFNSMGKFMRTLDTQHAPSFQFLGEELYTSSNNQLQFFNLYSTAISTSPLPASAKLTILTDERLYLINDKVIELYEVSLE
jgi:hypothetical protein